MKNIIGIILISLLLLACASSGSSEGDLAQGTIETSSEMSSNTPQDEQMPQGDRQPQIESARKGIQKVRLVNQESRKNMIQSNAGVVSDDRGVHVWPVDDPNIASRDGQFWYLVPVHASIPDDWSYYIVNAESEEALIQEFAGTRGDKEDAHVWPLGQRSNLQDPAGMVWEFDQEPQDGSTVRIRNAVSGKFLLQSNAGTIDNQLNVHVWDINNSVASDNGWNWKVEVLEEIPYPNPSVSKPFSGNEAKNKLLSQVRGSDFPEKLEEGVTSVEMISGIFVDDNRPFTEKIKIYYPLEKRTYWKQIGTETNYGSETQLYTKKYLRGWSQADQKSLSVTVGYEASAGKEGIGSVKSIFLLTAGHSVTNTQSGGVEETTQLKVGPGKAGAKYVRYSELILKDPNGRIIKGKRYPVGASESPDFLTIEVDLNS